MVWTNETRPICGAGPLDSLARAALPKKLAGRSDLHLALIVLTMFLFFIVRYSPLSPAGLESRTMRSPERMRRWAALPCLLLLAAGTNLLPEKFRIKRYKFWMRTVLFVAGWFFSWEWPARLGPLFGDPVVSE